MGDLHLSNTTLRRYLVILIGARNSFSNIGKSDPKALAILLIKESTARGRRSTIKNGKMELRWGIRKEKGWPTYLSSRPLLC